MIHLQRKITVYRNIIKMMLFENMRATPSVILISSSSCKMLAADFSSAIQNKQKKQRTNNYLLIDTNEQVASHTHKYKQA